MNSELGIPEDYGRSRGLSLQAEATALVGVGSSPYGRPIELEPRAADAWVRMREEALRDGVTLEPLSGFRSVARQREIIERKLGAGETIEVILRTMAAPGYSEHHTGRAIDIGTPGQPPLTTLFAGTAAFRWLEAHGASFGFHLSFPRDNPHGITYEPWHWCHRP